MDESLRHQRDTSLKQLEAVAERGRAIRGAYRARTLQPADGHEARRLQPSGPSDGATREWQQDCAAAINQLSGGSKAHWLARAYSEAFMVRSADGAVVAEVDAAEIIDRILEVLAQGAASLSRMDEVETASSGAAPRPRRFEFVHRAGLRPVCERAFDDSRDALARQAHALALILSCGLIDALLTDALEQSAIQSAAESAIQSQSAIRNPQPAMTFEARIAEAERAGLIRGACARLPPVARTYRDLTDANGELRPDAAVSGRDARLASQVLHVVMRDLDPGR